MLPFPLRLGFGTQGLAILATKFHGLEERWVAVKRSPNLLPPRTVVFPAVDLLLQGRDFIFQGLKALFNR